MEIGQDNIAGKELNLTVNKVGQQLIQQKIDEQSESIPENIRQELAKQEWFKTDYDGNGELPLLEIYFTSQNTQEISKYVQLLGNRINALTQLFGYTKDDLTNLKLFIDPTCTDYEYSSSGAFFWQDDKTLENQLWLKSNDWYGLEHELTHWITVGDYSKYPDTTPLMLIEGIATWAAWNVKSPEQQTVANAGNEVAENYRKIIEDGNAHSLVNKDKVDLDYDFGYKPARIFGGMLFDVIYDALNKDNKAIGNAWKTAGQFPSVREWITSIGLSADKIEAEWKERLNYRKDDFLKILNKEY